MLSLDEIRRHYPEKYKGSLFNQHMIKEYLQTVILNKIIRNKHSRELAFIGGTCLRFCHGLDRFSEDLDFDFFGNDKESLRDMFNDIAEIIKKEGMNCIIEHNYTESDNFCRITFTGLGKIYKLDDPRKKIWIKIDIQKNRTEYKQEILFINRFGFYYPVHLPGKDILLSMKAVALTQRSKARDMYDFSFLCTNARLNFGYIQNELKFRGIIIDSPEMLKEIILKRENKTDISEKEHEISLFLIKKENTARITSFYSYISKLNFNELSGV
jgi:predicted nucleotidyltransferase component of viral defense system